MAGRPVSRDQRAATAASGACSACTISSWPKLSSAYVSAINGRGCSYRRRRNRPGEGRPGPTLSPPRPPPQPHDLHPLLDRPLRPPVVRSDHAHVVPTPVEATREVVDEAL